MTSYENITKTAAKKLIRHGFKEEKTKSKHEELRLKGPATVVLFKTGKLLVQGSREGSAQADKLIGYLGISSPKKQFSGIAIGSDESLKGDTFGGIVVAAFKADDLIREQLKELNVRDSKAMIKPDIVKLATILMERFPSSFYVENIFPKDYNKMNQKMDVTQILNLLHGKCYRKLTRRPIIHIVDQYPGCSVGDVREAKADSKYLEVAAASVIARYEALKQIRQLEQKAGFFIPLGSSNVEAALLEIKKKSLNHIDYVKAKFSNVASFF